jgi:glycosyltransferase involved in cell wall biosynthesis
VKPRVLFAGRTRYRLPLDPSLRRKFDALADELDVRVLGSAPPGSATQNGTFRLVPPFPARPFDGAAFYLTLPFRIARELRRFRPAAVLTQSPYEAAAALVGRRLARIRAGVVVDVHGDWRTFTRLYGSRGRRLFAPLADAVSAAALRRADAVRTVSPYTSALVRRVGVEPAAEFRAFMDLQPFLAPTRPLPERPVALFVGVLERYKNVDGLAEIWRRAAPRLPEATLHIVGCGTLDAVAEGLVAALPSQTTWSQRLRTDEVVRAMDEATVVVLPSRSEGMGRVVVEALLRGRPVVGSAVGGIRDLIEDGINGILLEPDDHEGFAAVLVRLLGDRHEVAQLAASCRESGERLLTTPEEYAASVRDLVERVARA